MKLKKDLFWIGSSDKDLSKFPKMVRETAIFCLDLIREGDRPEKEKVLKGFNGASVRELKLNDRSGTFRVVYTVQFETTKQDKDLIEKRLQLAMNDYKTRSC